MIIRFLGIFASIKDSKVRNCIEFTWYKKYVYKIPEVKDILLRKI